MPLARPTFLRVCVANGSQRSVCTWCLRSLAMLSSEEELTAFEVDHVCDHADLQRFAPAAQRRVMQSNSFQAWVTART